VITGGEGDDRLIGTGLDDIIAGLDGDDLINGLGGDDVITGDSGDDILKGGVGNDAIFGGLGNDRLIGGSENDILVGGAGDDSIIGGAGNDIIIGGLGGDSMTGGQGADIFVYESIDDAGDNIRLFELGSDKISIQPLLENSGIMVSDVEDAMAQGFLMVQPNNPRQASVLFDADGMAGSGEAVELATVKVINGTSADFSNPENFIV